MGVATARIQKLLGRRVVGVPAPGLAGGVEVMAAEVMVVRVVGVEAVVGERVEVEAGVEVEVRMGVDWTPGMHCA